MTTPPTNLIWLIPLVRVPSKIYRLGNYPSSQTDVLQVLEKIG
ncbi:MAG: hypothetical protein AAF208_13135 [Cyanobacteria bacterium P01_A01_bin.45]